VEIRSNLSRTRLGASGGRFTSRRGGDAVAGIRKYCRQHRLGENTFRRWLKFLAGQEAARKLSEYQSEWRREKRRRARERAAKAPAATLCGKHRRTQSRHASAPGDACRGDELELNGRARVRCGPVSVRPLHCAFRGILSNHPEGMTAVDWPTDGASLLPLAAMPVPYEPRHRAMFGRARGRTFGLRPGHESPAARSQQRDILRYCRHAMRNSWFA